MKFKISQLANLQMGFSFRSRIERQEGGSIAVIQMKDLTDQQTVNLSDVVRVQDHFEKTHLVFKNDLIFRSRGVTNTAVILKEEAGQAVVAAPLIRLRVQNEKILPEYLCWFINQHEAQVFLRSRARGTAQKMISKESLEELEVIVPSLERQRSIVEAAGLAAQELQLMEEWVQKRKQYISGVLMRSAKENLI